MSNMWLKCKVKFLFRLQRIEPLFEAVGNAFLQGDPFVGYYRIGADLVSVEAVSYVINFNDSTPEFIGIAARCLIRF